MNKPTIVCTIRVSHTAIASIVDYYEQQGIRVEAMSTILRVAIEDMAGALVKQGLASPYNLHEAVTKLRHLRQQHYNRAKLSTRLAQELQFESDIQQSADISDIARKIAEGMDRPLITPSTGDAIAGPSPMTQIGSKEQSDEED